MQGEYVGKKLNRRDFLRISGAGLAGVSVLGVAACGGGGGGQGSTTGGGGGDTGGGELATFTLATPAKPNDYGWNQKSVADARETAEEMNVELTVNTGLGYEEVASPLRQAAQNSGFVIAQASGYNSIAPTVAQQTGVPFLVWDNPEANEPGLVANASTRAQQGAYLAGILAAENSESGTLGIIVSADDANWNKMSGGFITGARSVSEDIQIEFAQIGQAAYSDTAGGRRVANTLISAGADVIFGMGDGSTLGMVQAVDNAEGEVSFIDVIGSVKPEAEAAVLSSVLWNFEVVYKQAIEGIRAGSFGEEGYTLSVANDGISLLRTDQIEDQLWQRLQDTKEQIANGEVEIPDTTERSAVEELLNQ